MTEDDQEGEKAPWTIKGIKVALREDAVRDARREGLTMAEWMERAIPRQIAAGVGNRVIPPVQHGQSATFTEHQLRPVDYAGMAALAQAVEALTGVGGRKKVADGLARVLMAGAAEVLGEPAPARRSKRLAPARNGAGRFGQLKAPGES